MMEALPGITRAHFLKAMSRVPVPDPASPLLAAAAEHVVELQSAVHGSFIDGVPQGRFTLLNREVDFGSLENVEWRRELGEKNNRLWRMNLAYMGYLVPLFRQDARKALRLAQSLLLSMKAQNAWSKHGVFRDVWHPYTVSHRVINLLACMHLLHRQGLQDEGAVLDNIRDEIRLGAAFLLSNTEQDLQYNHLFKNYVSLALVAAAGKDVRFAANKLRDIKSSIHQQFLADGGPAERAPMYHLLSTIDLRILRDCGVLPAAAQDLVTETAIKAAKAAEVMVHPDGDVAMFNDSWSGEAPRASEMIECMNLRPEHPLSVELPKTGYVRLSKGGDNVVMDFGACGPDDNPGHAHADFLSLELSVDGRRTIVDPGVPTYSESELRNQSRSAHWHNGPTIDGEEPIEFWSSFRVGRRGYAYKLPVGECDEHMLTFTAWHDGYAHVGVVAARSICLLPGRGLIIADAWAGPDERPATSSFLVSKNWVRTQGTEFGSIDPKNGQRLRFKTLSGDINSVESAPYWERFGVMENGTRISFVPARDKAYRIAGVCIEWSDSPADWSGEWSQLNARLLNALNHSRAISKII